MKINPFDIDDEDDKDEQKEAKKILLARNQSQK